MIRVLLTLASVALLLPVVADASGRYDPRLRFRTITTSRFDIHYHHGEEAQAQRLAVIAEEVAATLDKTLGRASGRVQVILVDQTDLPNGWATPLPYNAIELVAAAPSAESSLGNTDDWLRLVFTHEYTHIVHLSRGAGWIGGLRRVFGRNPLLYPNVYLPIWQIEGLAVHEESRLTGQGRVPAADFRSILTVASAASRFEPIDRASGGLIAWPSGQTPYIYGAYFHEFLERTYGEDAIRRLTDATAGTVPYFGSRAFRKVFKRSLGGLWDDFERDVASRDAAAAQTATRLTYHGFSVSGPRFDRSGTLYYSVVNPHGFPSLFALRAGASAPVKIVDRYLGSATSPTGTSLVFDQFDLVRNVGLQSDLYARDATHGAVRRLTNGARASDPDVSPDGETIVFTVQRADRREIATMKFERTPSRASSIETLISEPGVHFASPRWSPDGAMILAERGRHEIVVISAAAKRVVATIATAPKGRLTTPSWTTDGGVLFASDAEGSAFRIYRATHGGEVARLEGTGPDARAPELSADGRTIAFVGYTADGYDLFSLPTDRATWTIVDRVFSASASSSAATTLPSQRDTSTAAAPAYSPWRTILPRFWTPVVEIDHEELVVGAATGSADALGRHTYAVQAGWAPTRDANVPSAAGAPGSKGRPDLSASYIYDRWWPTLFATVSDDTDPFRDGEVRMREANAGVILPFRHVRWSQAWLGAYHTSQDRYVCSSCGSTHREAIARGALRGGWFLSTARAYGYSISLERGWSASVTTELARHALGGDGNGDSAIVDVRGYVPVAPRHGVFATRVAAASSWGDRRVRRLFSASGSGPQPGGFAFGSQAVGLIRGIGSDDIVGRHAFVVNADYRVPLMRLEHGAGTLPLFARTLHGALFADAGHAWDTTFRRRDVQAVVGAEVSMDIILGYRLPLTIATGTGWASNSRGLVTFGRVGRAF
jgi:hypothetical protein